MLQLVPVLGLYISRPLLVSVGAVVVGAAEEWARNALKESGHDRAIAGAMAEVPEQILGGVSAAQTAIADRVQRGINLVAYVSHDLYKERPITRPRIVDAKFPLLQGQKSLYLNSFLNFPNSGLRSLELTHAQLGRLPGMRALEADARKSIFHEEVPLLNEAGVQVGDLDLDSSEGFNTRSLLNDLRGAIDPHVGEDCEKEGGAVFATAFPFPSSGATSTRTSAPVRLVVGILDRKGVFHVDANVVRADPEIARATVRTLDRALRARAQQGIVQVRIRLNEGQVTSALLAGYSSVAPYATTPGIQQAARDTARARESGTAQAIERAERMLESLLDDYSRRDVMMTPGEAISKVFHIVREGLQTPEGQALAVAEVARFVASSAYAWVAQAAGLENARVEAIANARPGIDAHNPFMDLVFEPLIN